jgi:hypothetical protein
MQTTEQACAPWYRHFWVWFVIALPLAAVIAGFATLWIAAQGADHELSGAYQKLGSVVTVGPAPGRATDAGD